MLFVGADSWLKKKCIEVQGGCVCTILGGRFFWCAWGKLVRLEWLLCEV